MTIGNSVTSIGAVAFYGNLLTSVTFLGNAPTDGGNVFDNNSDLSSLTRSNTATGWGDNWGGKPVVSADLRVVDGSDGGFEYTAAALTGATVLGCTSACPANLVIPQTLGGYTVTAIDAGAFFYQGITSVSIPSTVRSIGNSAFANNNLSSVKLPFDLQTIGNDAFYYNSIASVIIPYSTTSIGEFAFAYNAIGSVRFFNAAPVSIGANAFYFNTLTSLVIPNSVRTIGASAFGYNALTSLNLGAGVQSIGDWAFVSNFLTSLVIPNSVTSVGSGAFADNQIASLAISTSMTSISSGTFAYNNLSAVSFPPGVTEIRSNAFATNALAALTIPGTITSIGDNAFSSNALSSVTFSGNAPTAGNDVFTENAGLAAVIRTNDATGWEASWGGKPVVIADARAAATVKPAVSGTAKVNKTLTAAGTWTGYPTPTFTYQWYACTKAISLASATVPRTCTKISRATRSTFKLTSAQRGKYVAVLVTGASLRTAATAWLSTTTVKVK